MYKNGPRRMGGGVALGPSGVLRPIGVAGAVAARHRAAGAVGGHFKVIAEIVARVVSAVRGVVHGGDVFPHLGVVVAQFVFEEAQLPVERGVVQPVVLAVVLQARLAAARPLADAVAAAVGVVGRGPERRFGLDVGPARRRRRRR